MYFSWYRFKSLIFSFSRSVILHVAGNNAAIEKIINNKIKVTINTDNMTVSGTDEASEMKLICDTFGYDGNMRRIFVDNAIDAAFLSNEMKENLRGNL